MATKNPALPLIPHWQRCADELLAMVRAELGTDDVSTVDPFRVKKAWAAARAGRPDLANAYDRRLLDPVTDDDVAHRFTADGLEVEMPDRRQQGELLVALAALDVAHGRAASLEVALRRLMARFSY